MSKGIARVLLLLVGATIALATVGMGYGLWFGQLNLQGELQTGAVALSFQDIGGTPPVTPYTNDDHVVNNGANDSNDIGVCAAPVIDDDGDGQEGEDPIDGVDNDGDGLIDEDPPGKKSTCDPRSTAVWDTGLRDEDGDGLLDEDAANGLDDDGDGLVDEDGVGGWDLPFAVAAVGQDIGRTTVYVNGGGKLLQVTMANPSVSLGNVVYSPSVFAHVVNSGTIPLIVTDISMTLTPAYELWDRNGNGITVDNGASGVCNLDLGDECAAPLVFTLTGIAVGDSLDPGDVKPITLKAAMTPAAVPGAEYGLALAITGNQYNEPGA